ncbi:hypothetical protein SEMRO_1113_G242660.1 [Seminavis robusta]|uniref:Uncharacterized protein n=1 Tax=Seminavis robusta TaxID=568900 RepID=A0A9N8HMF8_9STRA|nr:hypothetical protein SEMRO_1113_G242660.1 [Seminavis robusta]|eukprot:Sro1113_g242660.1 n/a (185) ;mRNA; r:19955-20509
MSDFIDSVVAFGGPRWHRVLKILPVAEMDMMDDAKTRHPLLYWKLGNGDEYYCKCSSLEFQRWGDSVKYQFLAEGILSKESFSNAKGPVESWDVKLTTRAPWSTGINKMKGETSSARVVEIDVDFPAEDKQDIDIVRVEALIPKTSDVDKGKLLKKCVDWGKAVVDANLLYRDIIGELPNGHEI